MSDDEQGNSPASRPATHESPRRRRRRRGRKRGGGPKQTAATPVVPDAARSTGTAPPAIAPETQPSRAKRRRSRRPGRGKRVDLATVRPTPLKGSLPNRQQAVRAYAALDLGTNNCRLLIAVPQSPGRFRVVDAFSRIVRLGEGLEASGALSDAAMDRAVEALRGCAAKLATRDVAGVRLIATEACRRATNGAAFLERVERESGLRLEIIDRETEARLAVSGCSSLVDPETRGVLLFDIGGGSSELALLDIEPDASAPLRPSYAGAVRAWTSLPVGVVTLSERHGGGRKVTRPVFEAMVAEVAAMLDDFDDGGALAVALESGNAHLLGTSGTVTTLAGIHLQLPRYDRRRVDGTWMSLTQVTRIVDELVDMSYEQRIANPCIGRDRADLVLAGCAILVAIKNRWPCKRLRVADRGLREGLLTQMMDHDDAWIGEGR